MSSISRTLIRITTVFSFTFMIWIANDAYGAAAKWINVGYLHNFYQEHGSEPEEDYGSTQQFGLRWPAFWPNQDCQAAKGFWIGVANYNDPIAQTTYEHKVVHCGPRPRAEIEQIEVMPIPFDETGVGLLMKGRFPHPSVYVDNETATDMEYDDIVEIFDPNLKPDRLLINRFHTSVGISGERRIYGYSQQNNDNFHISEYVFTNTGICSKDETVTHNQTLQGVYFHWQYRYAVSFEGTVEGTVIDWVGNPGWGTVRNMRWGLNTMNEAIGEHPDAPKIEPVYPSNNLMYKFKFGVDEYHDNGEIIRAFYSWHGMHSEVAYDNIGSPNVNGYKADGRLGSTQFVGVAALHADDGVNTTIDDIDQPATSVKIESNDVATTNNDQFDADRMTDEYNRFCAFGYPEKSQAEEVGDGYPNIDANVGGGGYSQAIAFGPYTMAPGDSVRIVLAEGAAGISRLIGHAVGRNWYKVYKNGETITAEMPDPDDADHKLVTKTISTVADANKYKDAWVYTGKDSLIKTFRNAKNLWENGMDLGNKVPPEPPSSFQVTSQGNRIYLEWNTNAETGANFEGYKIYRAQGNYDSTYYEIADLNKSDGTLSDNYSDYTAARGQGYYYYIVSYDNGSTNNGVPLHSSPFWTRTNKGAYLLKPPSQTLDNIRIVPNPFNIRNTTTQYTGKTEQNKIMFLNLPEKCTIRIFTERGDLIYTVNHEGSGDNRWDLITSSRQIVVSGVYVAHFEIPDDIKDTSGNIIIHKGESTYRKFIVIR